MNTKARPSSYLKITMTEGRMREADIVLAFSEVKVLQRFAQVSLKLFLPDTKEGRGFIKRSQNGLQKWPRSEDGRSFNFGFLRVAKNGQN